MMEIQQIISLIVVSFLIVSLYREWFNPSLTFFICAITLLVTGVITPAELLKGLSNQQIVIIFLLVLVTAGIRIIFGNEIFAGFFDNKLPPKRFLLRMMMFVSSISAFLNNTPIVAFMIPYVKDWTERSGHAPSRFLIPLSFATILGGMITVIGTSTSLVLNGLIGEYGLPLLTFRDFFFLGLLVTITGWLYLYFIGYHLLPDKKSKTDAVLQNLKEYIVETKVFPGSKIAGKSVRDAGLRNLEDLFLVEIIRKEEIVSPVAPEEIIEEGDLLFFTGNTPSISRLLREDNGLTGSFDQPLAVGDFAFAEAVIPAGSDLVGVRIKDSDFRSRFNASIVAIHRDGKRVGGKMGDVQLSGGDFLLLIAGEEAHQVTDDKNLFFTSIPEVPRKKRPGWYPALGGLAFILLMLGITEVLPLFIACMVVLTGMIFFRILNITEIKRNLDLGLLVVLVCSLAVGVGLEKSGTANLLAGGIISVGKSIGPVAVLSALFLVTILLTSLITNAAAVSIMFPIAMAMATQLSISATPFFVAIAFAASGDFMTPIGYQTNLMVYGPGGYSFRDFVRVGTPLTILYAVICITYISFMYHFV